MKPRYYLLFLVPIWIIAVVHLFTWIASILSLPADVALYTGAATAVVITGLHVWFVPKFLKYVFYQTK